MAIYVLDCPHCKENILKENSAHLYRIDTPLRTCPHCGGDYLFPNIIEWSIGGPLWQLFYCFLANGRWYFIVAILVHCDSESWKTALLFALIWIVFSLSRLLLFDRKRIKASNERAKAGPAYIKRLSDLGYARIDIRLDPYYK